MIRETQASVLHPHNIQAFHIKWKAWTGEFKILGSLVGRGSPRELGELDSRPGSKTGGKET